VKARGLRAILLLVLVVATIALPTAVPAAPVPATTGVVEIETRFQGGTGAATGMVLTPSGEVLTNNHVIRGATVIWVHVPRTGRVYRARVLGYSVSSDVALLKVQGASGFRTVSLGNSSTARVGDHVTAVGNAGGTGTLTTKVGTITGLGRTLTLRDEYGSTKRLTHLIGTSADLRRGDSGGPLLDDAGRVLGMNAAASFELGMGSGESDGYAIPISRAMSIVSQIESGRASASVHIGATPFLGVTVDTSPSSGTADGVRVADVRVPSPAARAGLAAGDVIVSLNGHAVRTPTRLVALLLRWHPGDNVRLAWRDELGSRRSAVVRLASGPPQ
jgi:S1-C subfamily serine protease